MNGAPDIEALTAAMAPSCAAHAAAWSAPGVEEALQGAARRFGLPALWLKAVVRAESGGRVCAVSPAGALGLMQVMPATYRELARLHGLGADPFHPRDNLHAGAAYLRAQCDRFGAPRCFAAYNAGPARLARRMADGKPLPAETIRYVARISNLTGLGRLSLEPGHPPTRPAAPPSIFVARTLDARGGGSDPRLFSQRIAEEVR